MMMKSSHYIVFVLCVSLCFNPNNAHLELSRRIEEDKLLPVDHVSSSSFEMTMYPTPRKFDVSAADKVKSIIKDVLVLSSSTTKPPFSADAIEVLVERLQYKDNYEMEDNLTTSPEQKLTAYTQASLLEFRVTLDLSVQEGNLHPPTQFMVDNLVVRTFSQPSTKSTFIELIVLTSDPFLIEVEDIDINLVEENSNDQTVKKRTASLSSIDIVLIISSSFIFIGILCVFISHKQVYGYENILGQGTFDRKNGSLTTVDKTYRVDNSNNKNEANNIEVHQTPLDEMLHVEGNIVEAGSLESSLDSHSRVVLSVIDESPAVSFASSSSSSSTNYTSSSSSRSTYTSSQDKTLGTPIDIYKSSDSTIDSESIGSKFRQLDSFVFAKTTGELASKLLKLSGTDTYDANTNANRLHSSTASAPTVLENTIRKWVDESNADERSIKSTCSTISPKYLELNRKRKGAGRITFHPRLENQLFINGLIMLETTEEFHNSWLESKRKALEDIEEESVDDVFQIDVQENRNALRQKESTPSPWSPSVSDWMKSIRVVNSLSDTLSSAEHSSIEPRSSHAKENDSVDLSLEDSLATSLVDPELK